MVYSILFLARRNKNIELIHKIPWPSLTGIASVGSNLIPEFQGRSLQVPACITYLPGGATFVARAFRSG
jgi:hypothetical protein